MSRKLHIWLSLIFLLPLFVVAVTTVFIAHKDALGTENVMLWGHADTQGETLEIKAWLGSSRFGDLTATKSGIYQMFDQPKRLNFFPVEEYRAILEDDAGQLWVASKAGLWRQSGSLPAVLVKQGDFHSLGMSGDEMFTFEKKSGVLVSNNRGISWNQNHPLAQNWFMLEPEEKPYNLSKLMMDLHTGKAFLGKKGEWIWIDLLGICMMLLCITGATVWWRNRRATFNG